MKKENMVCFRISIYDCNNPQELNEKIVPINAIKTKWIAQTIADQVWIWYEFKDVEDRNHYIKKIEAIDIDIIGIDNKIRHPKDKFMHDDLSQKEIDYWEDV